MDEEEKSMGEWTTLGRKKESGPGADVRGPAREWNRDRSIGEFTTLRPEGILDNGYADAARRWKAGEEILGRYVVERVTQKNRKQRLRQKFVHPRVYSSVIHHIQNVEESVSSNRRINKAWCVCKMEYYSV